MYFIDGTYIFHLKYTIYMHNNITHLPNHISFQSYLPSTIADKTVSEGVAYRM